MIHGDDSGFDGVLMVMSWWMITTDGVSGLDMKLWSIMTDDKESPFVTSSVAEVIVPAPGEPLLIVGNYGWIDHC